MPFNAVITLQNTDSTEWHCTYVEKEDSIAVPAGWYLQFDDGGDFRVVEHIPEQA